MSEPTTGPGGNPWRDKFAVITSTLPGRAMTYQPGDRVEVMLTSGWTPGVYHGLYAPAADPGRRGASHPGRLVTVDVGGLKLLVMDTSLRPLDAADPCHVVSGPPAAS